MKQYYLTLLTIIAIVFSGKLVKSQDIDTISINHLNDRAYNLINSNPLKSDSIATYTLILSEKANFIEGIIKANNILSILDYYEGNLQGAKNRIKENIKLCIQHNSLHLTSAYLGMGNIYQSLLKSGFFFILLQLSSENKPIRH